MAYFPFIENLSYNQLSQWQKEVKAPSEHELNSVNITRLTQSITEKNRMDLFRCRAKRVGKDELCAVDSTSAYSHDIDPHSYDVDPLEEGMAFKEQSLFACKQAVVQLYKDITFSFSWTLHRE